MKAVPLSLGLFLFASLVVSNAAAGTLEATVEGKDGKTKPYVRVDIVGPDKKVCFTDKKGKFSSPLQAGKYKVRITEGRRRQEFEIDVQDEKVTATLKLKW